MKAEDDLLDTSAPAPAADKPKRKRSKKPAGPSETKPAAPAETKAVKAKAKPAASKKASPKKAAPKAGGKWSRAANFDEIKSKVKAKIVRLKEPVEVAVLAESLGFDTNNVRWAARELQKEKLAKVKLNSQNRLTVIGA